MNQARLRLWIFLSLLQAFSIAAMSAESRAKIHLVQKDQVIDVMIGGELFTTYHFADDFLYPMVRPFFWPVNADDGTGITIDQAQVKELHPYQRSIWIGHGDVDGADHWKFNAKPVAPRQRHLRFRQFHHDRFEEDLVWDDKEGQPTLLKELRSMRFIVYPNKTRAIDVSIRLTPIQKDVTFVNHGDHGFLSVRLVPVIAGSPQFTSPSGQGGNACAGRVEWCDESGLIDGRLYGAAMFDSPANPRHPPLWHAGRDARLATDIFALSPTEKGVVAPSERNFTIKLGQTATFHYRILIHPGDAASAEVATRYREFVAGK